VVLARPAGRTLIILATSLVVYQNVVTVITGGELFTSGPVALTISAILIAAMLLWARQGNLTLVELGITRHGAARGAAIGVGVAAAVAVAALVLLRSGLLVPGPVHYAPFAEMTVAHVVFRALILMPLATILPEELSFRGVLLGLLRRRYADGRAAVLSAIVFAPWHGLLLVHTVGETSLALSTWGWTLGIVGGFVGVAVGGWLFAYLRIRTGNLVTSVCCHWAFNASILVGLYALQQ